MFRRYGLWHGASREFFTYGGQIITHHDRAEMEFLVPGTPVREVPPSIPADQTLPIRFHPGFAAVSWPLDRRDFARGGR